MPHPQRLFRRLAVPAFAAGVLALPALGVAYADDAPGDPSSSATASETADPTADPSATTGPSETTDPSASASPSSAPADTPPAGLLCNGVVPTLWATANGQTIIGTDGDDVIAANGFHNLTLEGGAGNDVICGANVPAGTATGNTLSGGDGDDILISSGGRERLIGGAGNDRIIGTVNDDVDYSTDGYTDGAPGISVDLVTGTVTGSRTGTDTLVGLSQARIFGTPGNDIFVGDDQPNWFDGGTGADQIRGNGGDDWLHAVAPTFIDGGRGNDTLMVGFGGRVRGGPGNDTLIADPNNAASGASPDSGTAVTGYRLNGGPGNDTFKVNTLKTDATTWSSDPALHWKGAILGGQGHNTVDFRWLGTQGVWASLTAHRATWPTGTARVRSVQRVIGTPGNDTLIGSPGPDILVGLAGNDVLRGKQGPDVLKGNAGDDLLVGGVGRDRANGGKGHDTCRTAEIVIRCEA